MKKFRTDHALAIFAVAAGLCSGCGLKESSIPDTKAVVYNNRGMGYANDHNYEKAIEDYSKAIENNPKFAAAYLNRGDAYKNKSDYNKAIEDYSMAIAIDPKLAAAYKNRGAAYRKKGASVKAADDERICQNLSQKKQR